MIGLKLWKTLSRWSCKLFDYWGYCMGLIVTVIVVGVIFDTIKTPVTKAIAVFLASIDMCILFLFVLFSIVIVFVWLTLLLLGIDPDKDIDSDEIRTYSYAKQKLAKFAPLYAHREIGKVLEVARQTEQIAQDNKLELELNSKILKNTAYLKKLTQQKVFDDDKWLHNYDMSSQVEVTCFVLFNEWSLLKQQVMDESQKLKELADKKAKLESEQHFAKLIKLGKQIHQ